MKLTKYVFKNNNSDTLDVVLHGKSSGIESSFIQKIVDASHSHGNDVLAFNFPYIERKTKDTGKSDLMEEITTLKIMLEHVDFKHYSNVRLIGKSFGAIVANQFLSDYRDSNISLYILGCFIEDIHLDTIDNEVVIIQGDQDKYCSMDTLHEEIKKATSDVKLHVISGADHSFKDPETDEPKYVDEAINLLFQSNE